MANLFTFKDSSLARCFIKALYFVALVCITIGVVVRVGDLVMHRADAGAAHWHGQTSAGAVQEPAKTADANGPAAAHPDGQWARGHGNWHHHRHQFRGPAIRLLQFVPQDQQTMAFLVLMIVRTLAWGLVAIMVLRILAEMGLAILNLRSKPDAGA